MAVVVVVGIAVSPLFISYSHVNTDFVEAVERRLKKRHIRSWRDVHDLKAGPVDKQIDRAQRLNPTVVLVLSEASVESDWVEWEAQNARKLEKELDRHVLCPIAIDDAWKECNWPGPLRHQMERYNILDFSDWQKRSGFDRQFEKLVDGLGLFYSEDRDG